MSRVIELENVTRRFGAVTALHPVSLRIEAGEFFTLLGPSGSGKSTLLRILAGLETPSSGVLRFDGEDVTRVPVWKRHTAMVFQSYALYPHMTVAQNIGYPLKIQKVAREALESRVNEVAEALQIGHLLARKPAQLSGGQQQRVALARALAASPKLFLFDEPLSNLDARMRLEARTFIKTLQRELGITSIYVTHDQSEAMALSDRMAILENGHLRQVGTPREVYRVPADAFVASFVGSPPMTLLKVRASGGRLRLGEVELAAPNEVADGDALLGVRPEDCAWQEGHPSSVPPLASTTLGEATSPPLPAKVRVSEDFGHEILTTVEVAGQPLVVRHAGEPLPPASEGTVTLQMQRARVYPT